MICTSSQISRMLLPFPSLHQVSRENQRQHRKKPDPLIMQIASLLAALRYDSPSTATTGLHLHTSGIPANIHPIASLLSPSPTPFSRLARRTPAPQPLPHMSPPSPPTQNLTARPSPSLMAHPRPASRSPPVAPNLSASSSH